MCSNGGKNVAHKWFFPCRISVSHFHFLTKYTNIGKFVIFSPCFASCWCCCCCVFRCPFHFYLVLLHGKTHFGWLASEHYHFVCPPIFRKSSLSFTVNKMRLEPKSPFKWKYKLQKLAGVHSANKMEMLDACAFFYGRFTRLLRYQTQNIWWMKRLDNVFSVKRCSYLCWTLCNYSTLLF